MVTKYMFEKIRSMVALGRSDRDIARELKIDRKTVAKYRLSNTPPKYTKRMSSTRRDPAADFGDKIACLSRVSDEITGAEIFALLRDEGYTGSLRTVQRKLFRLDTEKPRERFFEQEYAPGEQSQFDFKERVALPFVDGPKVVHLHFGTLPHSAYFRIRAYPFRNYEAFMDGIHGFFEAAGGMTEAIRFDNLSPCVKRVLRGAKRLYTDAFEKALAYYDVKPLPCRPRKGSDKGDVEREIRTQARRIRNLVKITGRVFADFTDLNSWLDHFCDKHITAKAKELWGVEMMALKPLPPREDEILCRVWVSPSSKYGTVRVAKSTYSVPDHAIDRNVRVVVGPYTVKIYLCSTGALVAEHQRGGDCDNSIALVHTLPSLMRKPQAMVRWKHRDILFPSASFRRYYAYLKTRLGGGGGEAEREFLKAVNLVQYVALGEIGVAMDLVLEGKDVGDPFAEIKTLLLLSGHSPALPHPRQCPLIPNLSAYDLLIPTKNIREVV